MKEKFVIFDYDKQEFITEVTPSFSVNFAKGLANAEVYPNQMSAMLMMDALKTHSTHYSFLCIISLNAI